MTDRGWYDDPDGTPFRLRHWDGEQWTQHLAPAGSEPAPTAADRPRSGAGLKAALIGLAILTALGGLYTIGVLAGVVSGPGAPPSGRHPGHFDSPSAGSTPVLYCPGYFSGERAETITGDPERVYGGQLSMTRPPDAQSEPVRLAFADTQEIIYFEVREGWIAPATLGRVIEADGYTDLPTAAALVMHCLIHDPMLYPDATDRIELHSEAVTVDGHPAHQLRYEVQVAQPEHPELAGDIVDVIMVDTDDQFGYSFFFGAWPIDDAAIEQRITDLADTLRVER
ncbi:MAG: DUF2510 domain-containing protein [Brooklawnia sp.]|uniref:DUF2510 domain-containing protein n=1 Tax=Brooklawnia sp. TaxID=2699740 RepID=UPI003C780D91